MQQCDIVVYWYPDWYVHMGDKREYWELVLTPANCLTWSTGSTDVSPILKYIKEWPPQNEKSAVQFLQKN